LKENEQDEDGVWEKMNKTKDKHNDQIEHSETQTLLPGLSNLEHKYIHRIGHCDKYFKFGDIF